ncbi:hypothetical protein [Sulfitobacter sp.]|uniref:hypothetical protein n=1 Tax=Sulfitobacter sp. TaxID=1903071 RepID=UPI0030022417
MGFDIVFPSITNSAGYLDDNGDSYFPPVPADVNTGNVIASFLRDSASLGGVIKGEQVLQPFDWGTECVTYNKEKMPVDGQVFYGDLWADAAKGKAAFRQNP